MSQHEPKNRGMEEWRNGGMEEIVPQPFRPKTPEGFETMPACLLWFLAMVGAASLLRTCLSALMKSCCGWLVREMRQQEATEGEGHKNASVGPKHHEEQIYIILAKSPVVHTQQCSALRQSKQPQQVRTHCSHCALMEKRS